MPVGSLCLDTSAVVELLRGHQEAARYWVEAEALYLPCVALGELRFGAEHAAHPRKKHEAVDALSAQVVLLDVTAETALLYGRLKAALSQKGLRIPDNDLWVAAVALHHELPLLSKDRHFERIDDLEHMLLPSE